MPNPRRAIARGCGVRSPGGCYIEAATDPNGVGIEHFLIDPARPVPEAMELPNRGVLMLPRKGGEIIDVYDRVGSKHYPNVADFIEETRRYSLSRRCDGIDFTQISADSLIILAHERAVVENADDLYKAIHTENREYPGSRALRCPCGKDHAPWFSPPWEEGVPTCAAAWYELVTGGEASYDPDHPPRTVSRDLGSTRYAAREAPEGFAPSYQEGFFLRMKIGRLVVIRDPEGGLDGPAFERASRADVPVEMEDF